MLEIHTNTDVPTIVTAGRSLALALAEYGKKPTSPECLWDFQEAHWGLNRLAAGLAKSEVVIPSVPYSEAQLRQFGKKDIALFLPEIFSTEEGLKLLGRVYPQMRWDIRPIIQEITNSVRLFGWMRTEKSIDAPHLSTDEAAAVKAIKDRMGQTLNVYAEAGNQSKFLTGEFLDEVSTWIRVLNSRARGRVVEAYFYPSGYCSVD